MSEQKYMEEIRQVWEMVKDAFRNKLSETAINLWFGELEVLSFEDDLITMGIPSEMKFKVVNRQYLTEIKQIFCELLGFEVEVNLTFTGSAVSASQIKSEIIGMPKKEEKKPVLETINLNYNFEYTFENFIVGATNKFAHAACLAVAEHPATNYNPLFIYGNSGLGKTHLMYAIINRLKQNNPNINIIYTRGEDFTNQMISCLATKTMEDFHDKYRTCDVLLIDDIQFIAGKVSTQEEFFHTFNTLFEQKKQIILTSDRPPRDIKTLEDRLQSRFEWGLIADIEPPDLELRIAIIKKKAEQVNVTIPDEVYTYLGENLRSNIRQIEGAIKKLGAISFLSGKKITMEVARECIADLLDGAEPVSVTVDKIFSAIYHKYGVTKEDLIGKKRNKEIANARHVCIYLIRELTEMSYPSISKIFDKDHTTILHSYETMRRRVMENDGNNDLARDIEDIKKEVLG
ncbi:MAG: chromosomal replication initiator protein DnaA [Clostridia bacterium]|nr:chromosomal replication initiator protein DnaA [Clostridia bacterium]